MALPCHVQLLNGSLAQHNAQTTKSACNHDIWTPDITAPYRQAQLVAAPSGPPPSLKELQLPGATDTNDVGVLHMTLLQNQLSR